MWPETTIRKVRKAPAATSVHNIFRASSRTRPSIAIWPFSPQVPANRFDDQIGNAAVKTPVEYVYRFTEYRFAEYGSEEIRCYAPNGQLTDEGSFVTSESPTGIAGPPFGTASCSSIFPAPPDDVPEAAIAAAAACIRVAAS